MRQSLKHVLLALSVCLVLLVGCERSSQVVAPDDTSIPADCDPAKIVEVLSLTQPTVNDSIWLASLPEYVWRDVERYISKNDIRFFPEGTESVEGLQSALMSCPWDGTARWNRSVTQSNNYWYCGEDGCHYAVYFTVDGSANCYNKDLDWWVAQCVPTHGCVSGWDLQLSGDWYWNGNKWVKNVALVVPTTWWIVYYWHWPPHFKAARFMLYWNDANNGCCE